MKYNIIIFIFLLASCTTNSIKLDKNPYNAKGFAYIYNDEDYKNKIIKRQLDNSKLQISHNKLRINSLIRIINPITKNSIVLKNTKKINYPNFYKIIITKPVADKLKISTEIPLVEIIEIKKNKSFIAKKAKIFNEERKIPSNAPVTSVEISNISKNKNLKNKVNKDKLFIIIGTFYSKETADFLKKRITMEIQNYDIKKLKVRKKNNKEITLISGPYNTINLMKNDYILLKKFGFEELDFTINE